MRAKEGPAVKGGIILEYHRIAKVVPDPHALNVSPEHFAEHLEVIARRFVPTSLQGMNEARRAGRVTPGSVALTFDDGYQDNLSTAKPLLESTGIPAVFFVTLGYVESQREFWWDELERQLFEAPTLPSTLELDTGGKRYRRKLGDPGGIPAKTDTAYWGWHLGIKRTPTPRHRAYRDLHAFMRPLPPVRRARTLESLRLSTGLGEASVRESHRPVNTAELASLDRGELAEVGAHAMTHSPLATLPLEDQRREIEEVHVGLERILHRPIRLFSYPFGGKKDYTLKTREILENTGFTGACSSRPGVVTSSTDPLQLPRFAVFDWDGDHFEKQLETFFRG